MGKMIKAISLWEPWASLIMTGAKTIETRSWSTRYRGPLLICAAKGGLSKFGLLHILSQLHFQRSLFSLVKVRSNKVEIPPRKVGPEHLNFGKAVAIVDLIDCKPTKEVTLEEIEGQKEFGDFGRDRFAWMFEDIKAIDPFPVKGRQGLFNVELPYQYRGISWFAPAYKYFPMKVSQ